MKLNLCTNIPLPLELCQSRKTENIYFVSNGKLRKNNIVCLKFKSYQIRFKYNRKQFRAHGAISTIALEHFGL